MYLLIYCMRLTGKRPVTRVPPGSFSAAEPAPEVHPHGQLSCTEPSFE